MCDVVLAARTLTAVTDCGAYFCVPEEHGLNATS